MKKKLAMRIASLTLCVVFVGALFAAPKAKAVAVEAAAVSIGVAVLGSYLIATNMDLIGDTAETISNGITSLVSDFCDFISYDGTGDDWLSELGNNAVVTSPGLISIAGAYALSLADFVDWLTEMFGLDADGKEAVAVPGTASYYLYNGVEFPDIESIWTNKVMYPFAFISYRYPSYYLTFSSPEPIGFSDYVSIGKVGAGSVGHHYKFDGSKWVYDFELVCDTFSSSVYSEPIWSSFDLKKSDGSLFLSASVPVPVGAVSGQLELTRNPGFSNIAENAEGTNELAIYTALPGVTLEDLAADIPAQIAAGTLAPTVELTQTEEGTGEGEGTDDDTVIGGDSTTVGLLQSILNRVKAIPESISTSIADVFTPSQEAVDNLASEVDTKLPFIPVLKDFGSDLVYNLEHPEVCADGLGLTTVVDLGKGRGIYLGDTTHDLLDVSWYLEYKPLVDDLIVGFCWLVFLWNCYGALPRIIHGEGSTITVHAREFSDVGAGSGKKALGDGK